MYQLFGNTPEIVSSAMTGMAVFGALLAVVGGSMVARTGIGVPLHKSLVLGIVAILAYQGVYALAMKVLMS